MTTTKPRGWFGRTKLITIASIIGVATAGAFAISANVGILNAAGDNNLGELSAAGAAATPSTQVVDVYVDAPAATTTTAAGVIVTTADDPAAVQRFAVDAAGTIAVVADGGSLRLDSVDPTSGWTWSLAQAQPPQLTVTFTNGVRTLEFVADLGADGSVTATVNEPTPTVAASTAPTNANAGHEDDEHEGAEDDD